MKKRGRFYFFIAVALAIAMQSCFFADEFFLPPQEPKIPSLQELSEEAVKKYIEDRADTDNYKAYGFSDIEIHKPIELVELDKLEEDRSKGIKTGPEIDSLITLKRDEIALYKIQRTIELTHFFTLKPATGNINVLESAYTLNDTFGVINLSPKIILSLPKEYEETLNYYFFEYTIFLSTSYNEGRKLSNNFYTFFKAKQASLENIESKSAFLLHTLRITKQVKETGAFDPAKIASNEVVHRLTNSKDSITDYEPRQFSILYEKSIEDKVVGYHIFHKFIGRFGATSEMVAVQVDFSPYYEIESITKLEEPFEVYFNN